MSDTNIGYSTQTKDMGCCFVNTLNPPLSIKGLGFFKYGKHEDEYRFSELCELTYPHPDAPMEVNITLLSWEPVNFPRGFEKTAVAAIDAMQGLAVIKQF